MKKIKSKGERMRWTSMRDVRPIRLTIELTKGIKVRIDKSKQSKNLIVK